MSGVAGDGERVDFVGLEERVEEEAGEIRRKPEQDYPPIGWNAGFFIFHARQVLDVVFWLDSRVIFFIY